MGNEHLKNNNQQRKRKKLGFKEEEKNYQLKKYSWVFETQIHTKGA